LGYKLVPLAIALLAPRMWIGMGLFATTALLPIVEFYYWPPELRARVPVPEPWGAVLYSLVAVGLFLFRRHQLETQRVLVQAQGRAVTNEIFARKFLAVRDLANSPLQAIEATVTLLKTRHPEEQMRIERIERSLDRLRKLGVVLAKYEPQVWSVADQSFDPLEVLQEEIEKSPVGELDRLFLIPPNGAAAGDQGARVLQLLRFAGFGLDRAPDGAFWLDADGRLVYVNQAACSSLGYARSELLGMHISFFAPRISRDEWARRSGEIRHRPPRPYPSVHRRKDGTLVDVEVSVSCVEVDGHPYWLGFARDLASRKPE
jgi:PAS domain S-box-containing protein